MSLLKFVQQASDVMAGVDAKLQRDITLRSRVKRTFSTAEVAGLFGVDYEYLRQHIGHFSDREKSLPEGIRSGRDRSYTPVEVSLMRGVLHTLPGARHDYLFWRKPGSPLPVVTFGAQKGGTGKSLTAAHFAQYLALHYGLRVGVMDTDPQATASLYFADDQIRLGFPETPLVTDFMGASEPGQTKRTEPPTEELNSMWQSTPWPGIRLLPGGAEITNGDIALFFLAQHGYSVHRFLKDAIARWDTDYGPKTTPANLRRDDGTFDAELFERAMTETLDIIVIDQQPSLTLTQLNGVIAATNLVIPQTVKGIDLSTLTTYLNGIRSALEYFAEFDDVEDIGTGEHVILPTIVQEANLQDTAAIVDLYSRGPNLFSQAFYIRSDAIANASEVYKSIYEYDPPRTKRTSAKNFTANSNAVNDYLFRKVFPDLPDRGYSREFIRERWD